ncbi:helix-turn-helix transcriptional regulator [Marinobacterium arenosum]|uniref:helix-turn-helix transcriptional regulator n=1 Tax=Marinobacterium arenosum TaxID=2862496 RepID=UPI001C97BF5E|nr:helix-turn-helix transcriptional regulator [Marinobacterium arenosum]MBY4678168.1 helix-turn-helix transcriptional regulator [Marinobacterium arenosum]
MGSNNRYGTLFAQAPNAPPVVNGVDFNGAATQHWHRNLASLIEAGLSDQSLPMLLDALEQLVNASGSTLIVYPKGGQPYWPFRRLAAGQSPAVHIDRYVHGAYLLDPYYLMALEQQLEGPYAIREVAPGGFEQSEFYRLYYRQVNLADEICLIVQSGDGGNIQVSLSRHDANPRFAPQDKTRLATVFPLVRALLLNWWGQDRANSLESHLDRALSNFGGSLLTLREMDILQLILRGNSIKAVAQRLEISPETVKRHRTNIYAKLDISSQSELFHLFIDSLRTVTADSPADPLVNYLAPARRSS